MKDEKFYVKIFFIGLFLVIIQSFFQDLESLKLIMSSFYKYIQPFIYGLVIAVILEPLITFFSNKFKFGRRLGIVTSLLVFSFILIGVFLIVIPPLSKSIGDLIESFPQMKTKSQTWVIKVFEANKDRLAFLDEKTLKENLMSFIGSQVANTQSLVISFFEKIVKLTFSIVDVFLVFNCSIFLVIQKIFYRIYKENFVYYFKKGSC